MRVLVTGNQGLIGAAIEARLRAEGHEVVGFDRVNREDILNVKVLRRRVRACDAIVHSAALPSNDAGTPDEILAVNVTGTFNVLRVAEDIGAPVVNLSSVQALGVCEAPRTAVYLLCGDDIAASRPTREMVDMTVPDAEWRGGEEYDADPWRALVDCSRAAEVLGWRPEHRWADWVSARVAP